MTTETNITLDEMINSELITSLIEKEDKELDEHGWTYEEVKSFGESLNNKTK